MPELKLYTVADLRNWLLHNRAVEGLSEHLVSRTRAWAILNNPYVQADDAVVAAVFVEGALAAYTTAFPEMIDGQRKWWFSALWCAPEFRGKGFGIIVIGSLAETYGVEHCFDRWGAPDTVGIFTYLGHKTIYTPRFVFGSKINRHTAKGKAVYALREIQKGMHKLLERRSRKEQYSLRYLSQIDDASYAFMRSQRKNDCFFHSQEMLNWVLHYPFTISAPLVEQHVPLSSSWPSEIIDTQMYAVQVIDKDEIVGVYMMKRNSDCLHLLYMYYADKGKDKVFASVRDHVKKMRIVQFDTDDAELAAYIRRQVYYPKYKVVDVSFSHPESFPDCTDKRMQYGDGDNFAIIS